MRRPTVTLESVRTARTIFVVGLIVWLGGLLLASVSNGLLAVGIGSWFLPVLFFFVSAVGFIFGLVGLILWLSRRGRVRSESSQF